jgi:hypothetical protein
MLVMAELSGNPQVGRTANGIGKRRWAARANRAVAVEYERVVSLLAHMVLYLYCMSFFRPVGRKNDIHRVRNLCSA